MSASETFLETVYALFVDRRICRVEEQGSPQQQQPPTMQLHRKDQVNSLVSVVAYVCFLVGL